jgi:hypothetical protein
MPSVSLTFNRLSIKGVESLCGCNNTNSARFKSCNSGYFELIQSHPKEFACSLVPEIVEAQIGYVACCSTIKLRELIIKEMVKYSK